MNIIFVSEYTHQFTFLPLMYIVLSVPFAKTGLAVSLIRKVWQFLFANQQHLYASVCFYQFFILLADFWPKETQKHHTNTNQMHFFFFAQQNFLMGKLWFWLTLFIVNFCDRSLDDFIHPTLFIRQMLQIRINVKYVQNTPIIFILLKFLKTHCISLQQCHAHWDWLVVTTLSNTFCIWIHRKRHKHNSG